MYKQTIETIVDTQYFMTSLRLNDFVEHVFVNDTSERLFDLRSLWLYMYRC